MGPSQILHPQPSTFKTKIHDSMAKITGSHPAKRHKSPAGYYTLTIHRPVVVASLFLRWNRGSVCQLDVRFVKLSLECAFALVLEERICRNTLLIAVLFLRLVFRVSPAIFNFSFLATGTDAKFLSIKAKGPTLSIPCLGIYRRIEAGATEQDNEFPATAAELLASRTSTVATCNASGRTAYVCR